MLRVGILTYDFYPFIGGQGRVTYDLWKQLRERANLDLHVMSPARNELSGHTTRFASTQRFGRHPAYSVLATIEAKRWAREHDLDVMLVNGGPGGVLLMADPGVPIVYSLYHTYEQVARLTPSQRWKSVMTLIEIRAYARATVVTASTQSTAASLRDGIGVRAPIESIRCGVDFDAFPRLDVPRDDDLVVFVGRLDVRKNPQLLIQAFAQVARARPNARLAIIGAGKQERRLIELAAALGIRHCVQFARHVSHDDLVRWYNRAALVVVPSL